MLFHQNLNPSSEPNSQAKEAEIRLCEVEKEIHLKLEEAQEVISRVQRSQSTEPIDSFLTSTDSEEAAKDTLDDIMSRGIDPPDFQHGENYFDRVWNTFLSNEILLKRIRGVTGTNDLLKRYISEVEGLTEEHRRLFKLRNRKKNRRLAIEIHKEFECPYENCEKNYGSDVSLNLHIKLKHNGGNKTDRQNLAEAICIAISKGEPQPTMSLNLPPGFLHQYKKLYFQRDPEQLENISKVKIQSGQSLDVGK